MSDPPDPDFSKVDPAALADLLSQGLRDSSGTQPRDPTTLPGEAGSSGVGGVSGAELFATPIHVPGYRIVCEIGRGGMGCVYEAVQLSTRRTVALKVMLEGALASETARRRFEREVRIAAGLRHPHIAQVYESGLHEGRYWFSMELVAGKPLDVTAEAAGLGLEQRLALMATVCEAVGYAHEHGVVHRDLKPSNILVSDDGQPHVLDFGLARVGDAGREHELTLSRPGELMGTPAYMSPEQAGRESAEVDARSDVYSLGVVLYRLLTGSFPYDVQGRLDEVVHEIVTATPTLPSLLNRQVSSETEAILLKSLAKNPDERYASAVAFAKDLRHRLAGEPVEAKLASRSYRWTKRLLRKRKWLLASGLSAALIVVGIVAVWALTSPQASVGGLEKLSGPAEARVMRQMPEPRAWAVGVWLEGKLHVVGGETTSSLPCNSHFVYDPVTNQWGVAAPMRTARRCFAATVAGGKLYAIGGEISANTAFTDQVEAYDPETGEWSERKQLPVALRLPGVASDGAKVYVVGGETRDHAGSQAVTTGQIHVYDPQGDEWSLLKSFPEVSNAGTSGVIRSAAGIGHEVYVVVGGRGAGLTLWSYDTRADAWFLQDEVPIATDQSPCVFAMGDAVAVAWQHGIEGQMPVLLYSPAAHQWYEVDTSRIPSYGRGDSALASYEKGFYVVAGTLADDRSVVVQEVSCDAAIAALAQHLAPSPDGDVLLEHPFGTDGPLGSSWRTVGGSWTVTDGALVVQMNEPGKVAEALYPAAGWTDYVVECAFRHESAQLGFLYRVDLARGIFYELWLQHQEQDETYHDPALAELHRGYFRSKDDTLDMKPEVTATLHTRGYWLARKTDHRVRIEVRGRKMRAYVDGVLLLAAEDNWHSGPILSGGIGFSASTGCSRPCDAVIRDLRITKLAE